MSGWVFRRVGGARGRRLGLGVALVVGLGESWWCWLGSVEGLCSGKRVD